MHPYGLFQIQETNSFSFQEVAPVCFPYLPVCIRTRLPKMVDVNPMPKKILIIDDESRVIEICQDYLQAAAFDVISASNGEDGLMALRRERPDLIILDLMLPDISGFDLCRAMRQENDLPIIILTARNGAADRLLGLKLGADDYVTKPFSPRELVARIQMVLRRGKRISPAEFPFHNS